MNKRVTALVVVSVLVLLALIGVADPHRLAETIRGADPLMVLAALASYTLAIVLFALIWQLLIGPAGVKIGMVDNLRLVFASVFFNIITPTASYGGEAVRAYLLTKKFGQDTGRGVATIVAHRIIGTLSNSFLTLVLSAYLIIYYSLPTLLLMLIAFVTLSSFFGFLVILYLGLRLEWSHKVLDHLFSLVSRFKEVKDETRDSILESLESYNEGLRILLASRKILLLSFILGLATAFFVNLVAVLAFISVGGTISVENFFLILTFFSVARLIPTGLPEFVGSKEAILAVLYATSGLPEALSVAVIFLIRAATQLWMILLGGAVTLQLGLRGFVKEERKN